MKRWLSAVLFLGLLTLLLYPDNAAAQAISGLTGLLTDNSGGALPGVTIEVVSEATGQTRTATTADDGFFTLPLVPPDATR